LNVSIRPTRSLSGEVRAPPSKAHTHRALFAGLLSKGTTIIHNPLSCDDTKATANAISSLGARLEYETEDWEVNSDGRPHPPQRSIECRESGVTLRFTIPITSLVGTDVGLRASVGLLRRPLQPLIDAMNQLGVQIDLDGFEVRVRGPAPKGGRVQIPGNVSSQFISGLLLAAPMMEEGLEIRMTSPLESRGYVALTIDTMKQHGIIVKPDSKMSLFHVTPQQAYRPAEHFITGDYSSAAFLMSAAAVTGSEISITGLSPEEHDPDSAFLNILKRMGAKSEVSSNRLLVAGGTLQGAKVNISDCPDLGPVIAVLGTYAQGETEITGAERLRYKESDRLTAIASELRKLGGEIKETNTGLIVPGPSPLHGGTVESHGDHRIAMSVAVAALNATEPITIRDAQCVNKSYPKFFDDIRSLGVEVSER
jgi:3-phosphoshikimate 1-carboxyvinyltransferase